MTSGGREVQDGQTVDFVVFYAVDDQGWADWIASELEAAGHTVRLLDEPDPGSHGVLEVDTALRGARRTVVVVTEAFDRSARIEAPWWVVFGQDPVGSERRLIPVVVDGFRPPALLGGVTPVDLSGLDETAARERLRSKIDLAVRGSAGPSRDHAAEPPPFPGPRRRPPTASVLASVAARDLVAPADSGPPRTEASPVPWPEPEPEPATLRHLHSFEHPPDEQGRPRPLRAVAFSADSRWLATADAAGGVRLWDAGRRILQHDLDLGAGVVRASFGPDGSVLAAACQPVGATTGTVRLWDTTTGQPLRSLAYEGTAVDLAFSRDGGELALWSRSGRASRWDVRTGERLWCADAKAADQARAASPMAGPMAGPMVGPAVGPVAVVGAVSPDVRLLATTGPPSDVTVWELASRRVLARLAHDARVTQVRFSPCARWIGTVDECDRLGVWEATTGVRVVSRDIAVTFAFSPAGGRVAVRGRRDLVEVVEIGPTPGPGVRSHGPFAYRDAPGWPTFDPHGRWLCLHSPAHRAVYLHDLYTPRGRTHRARADDWVNAVAFRPDGASLVTATKSGRADEWTLPDPPPDGVIPPSPRRPAI